jgi:hypothetical protein
MGEPAQLSFAPKISGEFLSIWAKFAQIGRNSPDIFEGEPQLRGFAHFEQVSPKKKLLCTKQNNT